MRFDVRAWRVGVCVSAALVACTARAAAPRHPEVPLGELGGIAIAECGSYRGGAHAGSTCEYALDARLHLHSEGSGWWSGGHFLADFEAVGGGRPTRDFVADAQGVSNIEAAWAARFYELWFEQRFAFSGTRVRVGLMDLNNLFAIVPGSLELVNSSFGLIPTISANVPTSTYPQPGWGVAVEQTLGGGWSGKLGIFQGHPEHRARPFDAGAMIIGELARASARGGAWSLDAWHYGQPGGAGRGDPHQDWGAQIAYSTAMPDLPLHAFAQVGISPPRDSFNPYYAEIGLRWRGPWRQRPDDVLSLAVARAWFRALGGLRAETVPELVYSLRLIAHVYLQPDLQFVSRPLAGGVEHPDALVGFLRLYATLE